MSDDMCLAANLKFRRLKYLAMNVLQKHFRSSAAPSRPNMKFIRCLCIDRDL